MIKVSVDTVKDGSTVNTSTYFRGSEWNILVEYKCIVKQLALRILDQSDTEDKYDVLSYLYAALEETQTALDDFMKENKK